MILNHAFVEGNKRTGTIAGLTFLELNGFILEIPQKELVDLVSKLESKQWEIEELAEWLEKSVEKTK